MPSVYAKATSGPKPKPGHVVDVASLPKCDIHNDRDAIGCEECFRSLSPSGKTGVGIGQRLVVRR